MHRYIGGTIKLGQKREQISLTILNRFIIGSVGIPTPRDWRRGYMPNKFQKLLTNSSTKPGEDHIIH